MRHKKNRPKPGQQRRMGFMHHRARIWGNKSRSASGSETDARGMRHPNETFLEISLTSSLLVAPCQPLPNIRLHLVYQTNVRIWRLC